MNRLTEKTVGCFQYDLKDHKAIPGEFGTYEAFYDYSMAVKRLGEYEDTGLEPEEINALKARALMGALESPEMKEYTGSALERADRLIEQYETLGSVDHLRELVQAEKNGRLVVLPPIKVGDAAFSLINGHIFTGTVYYMRWEKHSTFGEKELISADGVCGTFSANLSDFGKTVFLTRKEAEAALAADTNVGNKETK